MAANIANKTLRKFYRCYFFLLYHLAMLLAALMSHPHFWAKNAMAANIAKQLAAWQCSLYFLRRKVHVIRRKLKTAKAT